MKNQYSPLLIIIDSNQNKMRESFQVTI